MILTEEELKEIIGMVEYDVEEGNNIFWGHAKVLLEEINLLKELELNYLSANATLSFKNQRFEQYLTGLHASSILSGNVRTANEISEILEGLK